MSTLTTAADQWAIVELANRFENAFDASDIEAHLATWVDDLQFDSPFGNYQGKEAYRAWASGFMEWAISSGGTRHLITNWESQVDGDNATLSCYLIIINRTTGKIMATAVFPDSRLQRVDGAWKFVYRKLEVDPNLQAGQANDPT